jgi:hypothetical protein
VLAHVPAVAKDLQISRHTLYRLIRKGVIPSRAVIRCGASVRLDLEILARLLHDGSLYRARPGRRRSSVENVATLPTAAGSPGLGALP